MRVCIFVVIPMRQVAKLPDESFSAGIFLARCTPAITTPISEGFDDLLEFWFIGENCAAFAHGDVMRWIKTDGCHTTKLTHGLTVVCRADSVATILYEPQIMLFTKLSDCL